MTLLGVGHTVSLSLSGSGSAAPCFGEKIGTSRIPDKHCPQLRVDSGLIVDSIIGPYEK